MRFLRMLTNAVIAGALGAAYLTILVLQLNPHVPLASRTTARWFLTLGAFYGVHLSLAFYVLMLLRQFFSFELFSPGWISVRLLAWLSAAVAAAASALMWLNLTGLPYVLRDAALHRFAIGTYATTASAVLLLAIAIAHYSFGRRGSKVGAALLGIAIVGSLALPIAARGRGGEEPSQAGPRRAPMPSREPQRAAPHVTVLLLDGASLDYIWPRAAEGRLPNFGRILDAGASMDLATIRPTQPDPVWASVATGMYPSKTGIRSAAMYFATGGRRPVDLLPDYCFSHTLVQLGIVRDEPRTSTAWRARPLWAVLNDYGISTGIVRWPLTDPAMPIDGFLVSDRFHQVLGSMFEIEGRSVYPPDVQAIAREAFTEPTDVPRATADAPPPTLPPELNGARWDDLYARAMHDLERSHPVQFTALRYQGLDILGHFLLRYAQPAAFGDEPDDQRDRLGAMLDRYYGYIDGQVGAAMRALQPGDLLLVVSGFGMQPVGPVKRLVARLLRQPDASGTHERAPDGFLLAYGTAVERGKRQRGAIVDVAPTILYYLGVPIGRDMDGFTRADLFTKQFTAERPITFIPSHGR